jgi:hypothetical protein
MQVMSLKGTITEIENIVASHSKTNNKLQSHQVFWMLQDEMPEPAMSNRFQVKNERIKDLIGIEQGDHVKVEFLIHTSFHKGTPFNNLHVKSITKL